MDNTSLISAEEINHLAKKHEKSECGEPFELGVVLYTDGGSRNAYAGYGVHGFIYTNTPTTVGCGIAGYTTSNLGYQIKGSLSTPEVYDIKTAAALKLKHGSGTPVRYIDIIGAIGEGTNNVAELMGMIKALSTIKGDVESGLLKHVHFVLDSKYVINAVLGRERYISNGMVGSGGKPLANIPLLEELYSILIPLTGYGCTMTVEWVKGHTDSFGNIQADKHASAGLIGSENLAVFNDVRSSIAQGHWKDQNDSLNNTVPAMNLLLDLNWYDDSQFDQQVRPDGMVPLFVGNHLEPDKVGQADANTTKGVVLVKDVPLQFSMLRKFVRKLDAVYTTFETNGPFFGVVNQLLKTTLVEQLETYGDKLFISDTKGKTIKTFDSKELMARIDPCATAHKALRDFQVLHNTLDKFLDKKFSPTDAVTDVTDVFYSVTENKKGKKDVKVLIGTEHSVTVNVNVSLPQIDGSSLVKALPLILTMGVTAPRRRVISSIKDFEPKLSILTRYEPSIGFRHYFIAEINTGESAIWTNVDSNLRVF